MIRGATLVHGISRALSRMPTHPRDTDAALRVAAYSEKSVLCALSGPFDELKSVLLPAMQNSL